MKRKATEGRNKPVKQAEVIGHDQEDVFWEKGLLGDHSGDLKMESSFKVSTIEVS